MEGEINQKLFTQEIDQLNKDSILNRDEQQVDKQYQDDLQIARFSNFNKIQDSIEICRFNDAILVMLFGTFFPENNELNVKQIYLKIIKDLQQYIEKCQKITICIILNKNQYFCINLAKMINKQLPLMCLEKTDKIYFIHAGLIFRSYFYIKSIFVNCRIQKEKYQCLSPFQVREFLKNFKISDKGLDILENGQQTQETKKQEKILQYLENYKLDQQGIPLYLSSLIQYFDNRQQLLKFEGIFRVQPGNQDVKDMEQEFQNENYTCIDEKEDPRLIASLIKGFFINLEIPIIPFDQYDTFLDCRPQDSINLIKDLPDLNQKVLGYLFQFLRIISKYAVENKMNEANLATCFTPCLFKRKKIEELSGMTEMIEAKTLSKVLEQMIKYFKYSNA